MRTSELQVPSGAVLVLDETALEEGVLSEAAKRSVRALQSVVERRMLPIDVRYFDLQVCVRRIDQLDSASFLYLYVCRSLWTLQCSSCRELPPYSWRREVGRERRAAVG